MTIENEIGIEQPELAEVSEAPAVPDDDIQKPVFNKIQVADVVKREKAKAYERGKREALMELQQQQQAPAPDQQQMQQQQPAQAPQQAQGLGGMQQMSQSDIERMIAEQAPQAVQAHVQQLQQDQMVNSFVSKMQVAEQKYPGLEADLNNLNYQDPRMHKFIAMANGMENTGDIMKEVLDNPTKMESLLNMAYNQPHLAQKALTALSDSIKTNQDALAQETQARDPLSQIKPSQNAGMDNGAMSVNDFRKMFRG